MDDINHILRSVENGDAAATQQLYTLVHKDLLRMANHHLGQRRGDELFEADDLVDEAFLQLFDRANPPSWPSRGHFFVAASKAMYRIVIDHARNRRALRRGGSQRRVELNEATLLAETKIEDLLAINEALEALAEIDQLAAQVVHLKYFAESTIDEMSEILGLSGATTRRKLTFAHAWLRHRLGEDEISQKTEMQDKITSPAVAQPKARLISALEVGAEGWEELTKERIRLIDKKHTAGLTPDEEVTLEHLQRVSLESLDRNFPAPRLNPEDLEIVRRALASEDEGPQ